MKYFLLFITGCCLGCGDSPELAALKASLQVTGEEVFAKQDESLVILRENTAALSEIKQQVETLNASLATPNPNGKERDPAALEPQNPAQAKPSHTEQPVAGGSAVRLYVTSSESCAPCVRLWKAVEAGEFDGFDVRKSSDFKGLESYPATRFKDTKGQWRVIYGFNDNTIDSLRHWTGTNQFVSQPIITKSFVSQPDLVSIHNQLRGGGQWTWPGDLATHLRTVHGVDPNGIPANHGTGQVASQRSSVRLISRGPPRGWRTNYQARTACPTGGCPR